MSPRCDTLMVIWAARALPVSTWSSPGPDGPFRRDRAAAERWHHREGSPDQVGCVKVRKETPLFQEREAILQDPSNTPPEGSLDMLGHVVSAKVLAALRLLPSLFCMDTW